MVLPVLMLAALLLHGHEQQMINTIYACRQGVAQNHMQVVLSHAGWVKVLVQELSALNVHEEL